MFVLQPWERKMNYGEQVGGRRPRGKSAQDAWERL